MSSDFWMPHGHCYFWDPVVLWLHVGSDIVIGLSYYSLPVALAFFAINRDDVPMRWLFWMFAAFILICGTGHFIAALNMWQAHYLIEGIVKALTAIISVSTAIVAWVIMPRPLSIPSIQQLKDAEVSAQQYKRVLVGNAKWRERLSIMALSALQKNDPATVERIVRSTLNNISRLKLACGEFTVTPIPVDFSRIVTEECQRLGIVSVSIERPISGLGAPIKISLAVREILQNAIDAGDVSPSVSVRIRGEHVYMTVRNLGKLKLPPEQLIPAYHSTYESKEGMGLAVALAVAQKHGGLLSLSQSDEYVTTIFKIKI